MGRLQKLFILAATLAFVGFVTAVFLFRTYGKPFHVPSSTMEPTIVPGDRVLAEQRAYTDTRPERGDIVVFRYPKNPSINYIKRVVGLPGDSIRLENNVVILNNIPIPQQNWDHDRTPLEGSSLELDKTSLFRESLPDHPYYVVKNKEGSFIYGNWPKDVDEILVPQNHVFVLGDNRDNSADSRVFGSVPLNLVVGRVRHVIYHIGSDGFRYQRLFKSLDPS